MPQKAPTSLTVRMYDVGFGDCFLLTFHYAARNRHVLVDFGTRRLPAGKTVKSKYMTKIAEAIRDDCGGKLDAVVVTHRHQDHISGFAPQKGKGPGDIIRGLKPEIVVQPWTEDPRAARNATGPTGRAFVRAYADMRTVLARLRRAGRHLPGERFRALRAQLDAIGMDGIKNPAAVKNLQAMAPNHFVWHGSDSGLAGLLPGVKTTVLGPPTVDQTDTIKLERDEDPNEFWNLTGRYWRGLAAATPAHRGRSRPMFPGYPTGSPPPAARWFIYYAMQEQSESLHAIVRMLDDAMNNTSVILLFEVGSKGLLFPGDAQYENWMYTLGKPALRKRLKTVCLYKVGHHGSRNATPRTLWDGFGRRGSGSKRGRLQTLLSTEAGLYDNTADHREVPRGTLVTALERESDLLDTQRFAADELSRTVTVKL